MFESNVQIQVLMMYLNETHSLNGHVAKFKGPILDNPMVIMIFRLLVEKDAYIWSIEEKCKHSLFNLGKQ